MFLILRPSTLIAERFSLKKSPELKNQKKKLTTSTAVLGQNQN